jgi:hypothetical protein
MTVLIDEIFDRHIIPEPNSGCWLWDGATNNDGYGTIRRNKTTRSAHRYAFEIANGNIQNGLCVCHKCDVPSCVNPDHLFSGTHTDNMRDRSLKGKHNWMKLSIDDVKRIKLDTRKQTIIANEYNVSRALICLIKSGKLERVGL